MNPVEIGIVGGGAVTEHCHLPAAQLCPEVRIVALAETSMDRARSLANRFNIAHVSPDYRDIFDRVQGVIFALPNYLHAPVSVEFLERGIPVLVEKPIARTSSEAEAVVKVAQTRAIPLQVGHFMRFYRGAQVLKQAVAEDWLGSVRRFTLEWGFVYNWPVASGSFGKKEHAGGGVLMDTGSHMLDLLLWWLGGVAEIIEYRDDALGGMEAESELRLALESPAGPIHGEIVLSRLRKLANVACIEGDRYTIQFDFRRPDIARLWPTGHDGGSVSFTLNVESPSQFLDVYIEQLRDFARVIRTGGRPLVPGEESVFLVTVIEQCYRRRRLLGLPWMRPLRWDRCQLVAR